MHTKQWRVWAMDDRVDLRQRVLGGWGHDHEDHARQDGRWCMRRSRLTRLRLDIQPKET